MLLLRAKAGVQNLDLEGLCFLIASTLCLSDILGICKSYEDATKITIKASNREVYKRNVTLIDMSGKMVSITFWGGEVSPANFA